MRSPLTSLFAGIIHRIMHRTLAFHSRGWRDTSMLSCWPWGPLPRSTCLPSLPSRLPSNSSGVDGGGCRAAPDRAAWEPRHPIHTVVLSSSVVTVAAVIAAIVLPYILGVSGVLPASAAEWVLRVTAAGFAMEQSVPQYQQVVGHYGPPDYVPLGPGLGLAVLCAYALAAFALATWRLRRRDA
jgi:hypothetical protein